MKIPLPMPVEQLIIEEMSIPFKDINTSFKAVTVSSSAMPTPLKIHNSGLTLGHIITGIVVLTIVGYGIYLLRKSREEERNNRLTA